MKNQEEEYEPFGPEWRAELMKMTKSQLIQLIKNCFKELARQKTNLLIIAAAIALTSTTAPAQNQDILAQMRSAPKLCDSPAADSIFDRNRLPAIKNNADSSVWEFCALAVRDLRPDAAQFRLFCVAEFVEIGGQLFYIGQPAAILPGTTASGTDFWHFYDSPPCQFLAADMLARSTSLTTWFFTNPAFEAGCIHCVRIEAVPSLQKAWRVADRQIFCKP